jgi:hypothetical protein
MPSVRKDHAASAQGRTQRPPGRVDPPLDQRGDGEAKVTAQPT